ncbi:hypothetical protein BP6252_13072 [Coleophoma cylindrospora]|uniref:Uncharacterized protein n=1 Tax=Coleophoma cylindrospora TaxID=1849047 RepID=A0A3D8Q9U3_9HELO|nr:hypothetical protein BP6252_13072 [Coleophoma cylindrospora]
MKISVASIVATLSLTSTVAADDWQCNGAWGDGGLRRYSFKFQGYCEDRYGQCFLDALRSNGLPPHNWQAWDLGDGWWEADFSLTAGMGPEVNNAIKSVTNTWRGCWNGQ